METFFNFIWILFIIAGLILWQSQRGNFALYLGLIGLGINGFVFALHRWNYISSSQLEDNINNIRLVGIAADLMLIAGVVMLARDKGRGIPRRTNMATAHGANLITLFTPRNDTNTYSRAEALRDDAFNKLVAKAREAKLGIVAQRSPANNASVWFRIDYQLPSPAPELSLCASVTVTVERFDYHRFEHTFTISTQVGTRVTTVSNVLTFDGAAVDSIHKNITMPGHGLRLANRLRQYPWQLWRPKNSVQRLKTDWANIGLVALGILLCFIPFIGIFLMLGVFVFIYFRNHNKQTFVLTTGRPFTDPRALRWMDSWQVSIRGLGAHRLPVSEGIQTRLRVGSPEGTSIGIERFGYWGTDNWVERDQVAIRHRRAIGFIHVETFGEVLYVAWESHLNSASWIEQTLAQGLDSVTGRNVVANRVIVGSHRLNEYDVSDSNFLSEWMHEAVKSEIILRMAEHKIDQEIDFTVQRESRKDALSSDNEAQTTTKKSEKSKFQRVG